MFLRDKFWPISANSHFTKSNQSHLNQAFCLCHSCASTWIKRERERERVRGSRRMSEKKMVNILRSCSSCENYSTVEMESEQANMRAKKRSNYKNCLIDLFVYFAYRWKCLNYPKQNRSERSCLDVIANIHMKI